MVDNGCLTRTLFGPMKATYVDGDYGRTFTPKKLNWKNEPNFT
jgi:hypothetical protein